MAIALGSGDARGIRHVLALEALDETGISPVAIAGRSMSAIIAGAYAARIKGILFGPIIAISSERSDVMNKLLRARGWDVSLTSCCAALAILYCWLPRFVSDCSGFPACPQSFRGSRYQNLHCGDELS